MNAEVYKIDTNILNDFKTSEFKKLTSYDRERAAHKLSNYIFNILNLKPITINFDSKINYGSYSHFDLKDKNDFLIKYNNIFLTSNEQYVNYRLLASIIHEIEHYRQEIQEPEKYLQTVKSPTANIGLYINQPHEKEAYLFEIQMLKSMCSFFNDPEFDEFIKLEEREIETWFNKEKNDILKNGFIDNTYAKTLNEIVNTYSIYLEPINELLKCTSGRLNFTSKSIETKNIKGIIAETDNGWSCKLLSKNVPPIIIEFGLNKGTCKISRIYKAQKYQDGYISISATENEKFKILNYIPNIVKEYEKQTKQSINCLNFCPYSIDDFADDYKKFLYHIYHRENILDKILKHKIPENVQNIFEYNLKENKYIADEFNAVFNNQDVIKFDKNEHKISEVFDNNKLDELILFQNLAATKNNKEKLIEKNIENNSR